MKRSIFGIFLFICLLTPVVLTFFILKVQIQQVKREVSRSIKAGIDKKELILIKFTEKDKQNYIEAENSKEIEHNGEMYDIVKSELKGDTIYNWCWHDYKETFLFRQLKELFSISLQKDAKSQKQQEKLTKFLESLYFSEIYEKIIIAEQQINNNYYYEKNHYKSVINTPPIPPP